VGEVIRNQPRESQKGFRQMKMDAYADIYLWNRNVDRLIRVLQRMEIFSIRPKQEMKAYEVRLEEIRAALNADFAEAMATRERSDQTRLTRQRTAWEQKSADGNTVNPRH
jgi:hypothetical protein